MSDTVEQLQKKIEYYEKVFGIGSFDPATNGYMVLVEQLRQRNEFLKGFKISEKIGNAVKDDPVYARAIDLIDTLPKMISSVNGLKLELKIEYDEAEGKPKRSASSPQNIGQ